MIKRSIAFLAAFIVLLATGCNTPRVSFGKNPRPTGFEDRRALLAGKWLGEAPLAEGGRKVWLMDRAAGGTYVITFRNYRPDGQFSEETEYGDWGLSADIYFTLTRGWITDGHRQPVGTRESYYDDAYRIIELTPQRFAYTSLATGTSYVVRKVSDSYSLATAPLAPSGY